MITALFAIAFGIVGVGIGLAGSKPYVAKQVNDEGEYKFSVNGKRYVVTRQYVSEAERGLGDDFIDGKRR